MIQVWAQWAGHHQDEATGATKVWAACWAVDANAAGLYMAIWRHDPGVPMQGQQKELLAAAEGHYLKMIQQKQRKGYREIDFEAVLPEYVPSFKQRQGQQVSEAMAIAMKGYTPFRHKKGDEAGVAVGWGVDWDPDPVRHGEMVLEMLRSEGDVNGSRLILGYQRAKIRLEVQAEFGRRKAERRAAAKVLSSLRHELQILLVGA